MIVPFEQDPSQLQLAAAMRELESCNRVIRRYGLSLSEQDVQALVVGRTEALQLSDRIEFGGGVTKQLVLTFAGSPYVSQATFVETMLDLQDLFYEVKNESLEQIPDEELIAKMRSLYDDVANGDMEYLAEALLDGLSRRVREEAVGGDAVAEYAASLDDDAAEPGADDAVMNGFKLAAHRYDVSKWVDETYAPPWDGASWMDE
jgi:hypothetical protein